MCSFVKDLGKDPKTAHKRVAYKKVSAMLNDEEGTKTKAKVEFMGNVSPAFLRFPHQFSEQLPRSSPFVR